MIILIQKLFYYTEDYNSLFKNKTLISWTHGSHRIRVINDSTTYGSKAIENRLIISIALQII